MQIEDVFPKEIWVGFRWIVTVAFMIIYGYFASYNLQQLHIEWKRKRGKGNRPAESMIGGNGLILAAFVCPYTYQSEIALPFWVIMFFVDPHSWLYIALPAMLFWRFITWIFWPVKFIWQKFA